MTEPGSTTDLALLTLARSLADDPSFMAHLLARYQAQEHLSEEALLRQLGLTRARLTRLALCRRPNPSAPDFAIHIREIAAYVGLDPDWLIALIGQAEH